jgi:hypothetical protein
MLRENGDIGGFLPDPTLFGEIEAILLTFLTTVPGVCLLKYSALDCVTLAFSARSSLTFFINSRSLDFEVFFLIRTSVLLMSPILLVSFVGSSF